MKRRFIQILRAASSALLKATLVLWIGSYFVDPSFNIGWKQTFGWSGEIRPGSFSSLFYWVPLGGRIHQFFALPRWPTLGPEAVFRGLATFRVGASQMGPNAWDYEVIIPLWCPAVVFATIAWLSGHMSQRLITAPGVCVHCGYDLRATPDRCPECGTVVAPSERGVTP